MRLLRHSCLLTSCIWIPLDKCQCHVDLLLAEIARSFTVYPRFACGTNIPLKYFWWNFLGKGPCKPITNQTYGNNVLHCLQLPLLVRFNSHLFLG